MADFPAMPLFCEPLLADTDHLSDAEMGLYMRLLAKLWLAPNNRFPNDDEWLARKFRRTVEQVRAEVRPLLDEFFKTTGNHLYHKRLDKEASHVKRVASARSASAKARWEKEKGACERNAPTLVSKTPPSTVETQITVPPTGGTAAPPEAAKAALWREMKAQIGGKNPGSLAGKWAKKYGLAAVTDAHFAAMVNPPADYVEWMVKRLEASGRSYSVRAGPSGRSYISQVQDALSGDDDDGGYEAALSISGPPSLVCPGRTYTEH